MIPYTKPNGTNISAPVPCSNAGIVMAKLTIAPKIAPRRTGCKFMPSAIPITNPIRISLNFNITAKNVLVYHPIVHCEFQGIVNASFFHISGTAFCRFFIQLFQRFWT
jgi:hypothetical protein